MTDAYYTASVGNLWRLAKDSKAGHAMALSRLQRALNIAFESGQLDQEETDHLNEIMRIIREDVSTTAFATLMDFMGEPK